MTITKLHFKSYINKLKKDLDSISLSQIEAVADTIYQAYKDQRQIFIMGNGGSAATASHFACDLAENVAAKGKARFRVISLTDNVPLITAISNDLAYKNVFTEQLRCLLRPRDIVICISGSGNSPNIIEALKYAEQMKAHTIGILGFDGGISKKLVNQHIHIKCSHYGRIEDVHLALEHMICDFLNKKINMRDKAVFLDRDGTINKSPGLHKYITKWEEFKFVPGVKKAIRELNKRGYLVIVATNQKCIAKGLITRSGVEKINEKMKQELEKAGAHIDDIFYCPHDEKDNCNCRKPKPGLLLQAARKYNIDLTEAWLIGNSNRDIEAGKNVGCKTIRIKSNESILKHLPEI